MLRFGTFGRVSTRLGGSPTALRVILIISLPVPAECLQSQPHRRHQQYMFTYPQIHGLKCCAQPNNIQGFSRTYMILKNLFVSLNFHVSAWLAIIRANTGPHRSSQGTFFTQPLSPAPRFLFSAQCSLMLDHRIEPGTSHDR